MIKWRWPRLDEKLMPSLSDVIRYMNRNLQLLSDKFDQEKRVVVNVQDFGQPGTGNDDTSDIARAIREAAKEILLFPKPRFKYVISAAVQLEKKTRMIGAGWPEFHLSTPNQPGIVPDDDAEIAYFTFSGSGSVAGAAFGRGVIQGDPGLAGIGQRVSLHDLRFGPSISTSCISGNNMVDWELERIIMDLDDRSEHGLYISSGAVGLRAKKLRFNKITDPNPALRPLVGSRAIQIKGTQDVEIDDFKITGEGWDGGGVISSDVSSEGLRLTRGTFRFPQTLSPIRVGVGGADDTNVLIDDHDMDGGFTGVVSSASDITISRIRAKNMEFRAVEIDGTGRNVARSTITLCQAENCAGGAFRVVDADDDTRLIRNWGKGSGAGIGIDYDSGSIVNCLLDGNEMYNFATKIRNPGGCPVGTNF